MREESANLAPDRQLAAEPARLAGTIRTLL
jgi:hypothetical protein